jgi:DNA replication protein DnaC
VDNLAKNIVSLQTSMPSSLPESKPCGKCRWGELATTYSRPLGGWQTTFCDCEYGQKLKLAKERQRQAQIAEQWGERVMAAGIPDRFREADAGDYVVVDSVEDDIWHYAPPYDQLEKAVNVKDGKGAYLWGGVGTGKTHAAVALLGILIEDGYRAQFVSVPDLLDQIRATFNRSGESVEDVCERPRNGELVLLDDLGAEKPSEWVREKLYQIINARYNARRCTIVTSNKSPEQLAKQIGDRAVSRLMEMCEPIKFEGPDRRLKKR